MPALTLDHGVYLHCREAGHFPTAEMFRQLAETIPGAQLHVVAGGGHFPNRTHRREVQEAIGRFLVARGLLVPAGSAREGRVAREPERRYDLGAGPWATD